MKLKAAAGTALSVNMRVVILPWSPALSRSQARSDTGLGSGRYHAACRLRQRCVVDVGDLNCTFKRYGMR
jgi:hypothetical protein